MDELEKELKLSFLEESIQLLDDTEQAFLDLERSDDNTSLLDRIFRLAHNIKGTSRAVGFGDVAEFTHELENMLLMLKVGQLTVDTEIVTLLLKCNDYLRGLIEALQEDMEATFDSSRIIAQIHSTVNQNVGLAKSAEKNEETANATSESTTDSEVKKVDVFAAADPSESSLESNLNSDFDLGAINKLKEFDNERDEEAKKQQAIAEEVEKYTTQIDEEDLDNISTSGDNASNSKVEEVSLDHQQKVLNQVMKEAVQSDDDHSHDDPSDKSGTSKKKQIDETIRVKLREVELLNNFVGELVILQTVLNQHKSLVESELIQKTIGQLDKLSKEIQAISMGLRMVPIKQTFQKMQRIVRDTSNALGKKVNLVINGETTEVDKTVLEHLGDPLVHIIRNAVDHGLESTPQERVVSGKPETGTIELNAYHEGNTLVIEISDDGLGIDAEVIKKKAIEKGIISEGSTLSEEEIINLIFLPSFSTKAKVSEISGRGVGMDVVKTNIQGLSGEVRVRTKKGEGSTFRVVLPLTLAIIEGMIVELSGNKFVFPMTQVQEILQPKRESITRVTGLGDMLTLRGEVMPVFKLGDALGVEHQFENVWEGIVAIVRNNGQSYAVFVDEISRLQQVVIKKLGEEIKRKKGMIDSAILGDGLPSIIIDLNELFSTDLLSVKNTQIKNQVGAA